MPVSYRLSLWIPRTSFFFIFKSLKMRKTNLEDSIFVLCRQTSWYPVCTVCSIQVCHGEFFVEVRWSPLT